MILFQVNVAEAELIYNKKCLKETIRKADKGDSKVYLVMWEEKLYETTNEN